MLQTLLKTRLRRHLLGYAFTHPGEDYYVRELAALVGEDSGNLSRELKRLENEGLFISRQRGRIKLYSLNRDYPLFNELKSIVFKTEGVEGAIKELISKFSGIRIAFLFGSYATGREKSDSDVDVVLVGAFDRDKFVEGVRDLESRLNREINFTAYSDGDYERELKNKGSFLNEVLKSKVIYLKK